MNDLKISIIRLRDAEDGITIYKNGDGCELKTFKDIHGVFVIKPHAGPVFIPYSNILKIHYEIQPDPVRKPQKSQNENTSPRG
jgi:hypothetical protein